MKSAIRAALVLSTITTAAVAQVVTPVWVQHMNGEEGMSAANRLPILRKTAGFPNNSPNEANDGTSLHVSFGKLLPYDSTRYLLFVRENGINEATATPADAALALQYPDRSLIWINAASGAPMGIAHVFGVQPVVITGQGNQLDFFNEYGISGDGTLYYGHKNKILRYAKTGTDSWSPTPSCAWTEPTVGATDCDGNPLDDSTSGDQNQSFRWREFRVTGAGTSTLLFCGGGTWRAGQQPQLFKTTDSTNFFPLAKLNNRDNGTSKGEYALGGQASRVVRHGLDSSRPNLETVYTGHYPGTGYGARPNRYQSDPSNPARIITPYSYTPTDSIYIYDREETATNNLPAFVWEAAGKDGLPQVIPVDGEQYYDGNWSQAIDAHESLDYIVSYSMPSWDNQYGQLSGTNYHKPGWIGVHRLDGSIALNGAWKLPCTEYDIKVASGIGNTWGYCGDVTLYPDAGAPANLDKASFVWSGGAYGFGVFTVQNVAAAISSQPPTSITINELDPLTISAEVTGSPNSYQWTKGGVPIDGTATNADGTLRWPKTVLQGANKPKLYNPGARAADSGIYKLNIVNPISGATASVDVNVTVIPDTVPPVAVSAGSMDGTTVDICFNEKLDPVTAVVPANYSFVSGGSGVGGVELRLNNKAVRLYVTGLASTPGTPFTIKVANVRDYTGTPATAIPAAGQNVAGTVQSSITTTTDILGNPAYAYGYIYSCASGEYEVESGGADIWGGSDNFHFAYRQVTGDFDVRVQIAEETLSLPGNRNGIMLRESATDSSRFNYITWNPGGNGQMAFHVRETDATEPVWRNPENTWLTGFPPPNAWLRLKRQGNTTSAFRSTDGINWTAFGTTTNLIADPALLGLATCNGGNTTVLGYTRYAHFENLRVLSLTSVGGVLTLSWTGGGVLKTSTSLAGPYNNAPSQSNPQVVSPTDSSRYYKLE